MIIVFNSQTILYCRLSQINPYYTQVHHLISSNQLNSRHRTKIQSSFASHDVKGLLERILSFFVIILFDTRELYVVIMSRIELLKRLNNKYMLKGSDFPILSASSRPMCNPTWAHALWHFDISPVTSWTGRTHRVGIAIKITHDKTFLLGCIQLNNDCHQGARRVCQWSGMIQGQEIKFY